MKRRFVILAALLIACLSISCSPATLKKIAGGRAELEKPAVTVPFELVNGAVIVPVRINDSSETLRFMVDTNTLSGISIEAAKKLGIEELFHVIGREVSGEFKDIAVGAAEKIEVGEGIFQTKTPLGIQDLGLLARRAGIQVDGLLGNNFLRHFEVTFDYKYKRLIFQMPYATNIDEIIPGRGVYVMPFDVSPKNALAPKINGRINGLVKASFIIDTGNLGDTFITHDAANYLGYLEKYSTLKAASIQGEPIGGYTGLYQQPVVGQLKSIDFGAMHIGPHLFFAAQGDANLLGYSTLRNYRITLNYEKTIVVFREWNSNPNLNIRLYNCGFAIGIKDGKYMIIGLVRGSAAEKAGISPFDVVQKVNGTNVEDLGLLRIQQILMDNDVETVELVLEKKPEPILLKKVDLLTVQSCILQNRNKSNEEQ